MVPAAAPRNYDVYAYEVHAHEMHAREVHAREVHASEMYFHEVHIHEVHTCEVHTHEVHAYAEQMWCHIKSRVEYFRGCRRRRGRPSLSEMCSRSAGVDEGEVWSANCRSASS